MNKKRYKQLKEAGLTDKDIDTLIEIAIYKVINNE